MVGQASTAMVTLTHITASTSTGRWAISMAKTVAVASLVLPVCTDTQLTCKTGTPVMGRFVATNITTGLLPAARLNLNSALGVSWQYQPSPYLLTPGVLTPYLL